MSALVYPAIISALLLSLLAFWLIGERGRLLRRSTWLSLREGGIWAFLDLRMLHLYFYGRWPKQYIVFALRHVLPRFGPRGRQWCADHYHGKVLTPDHARSILTVNRTIPLQDLEQIIPYSTARKLVIEGPSDIVVHDCACRLLRAEPCLPIQVCFVFGRPFTDFVLEHHPQRSRRIGQTEALEILEAEHRRGHLHVAWFKDVCFDRFYAVCNCCKCCCGGLEAMIKYDIPMIASSGYVAVVDERHCPCGDPPVCNRPCQAVCPFEAIRFDHGKVRIDGKLCMGCGACLSQCQRSAMRLVRDPNKGDPLDIRLL
jgi:Pyruvate/2-oxoacid:ferredoxin oxidoreductase delta subunit